MVVPPISHPKMFFLVGKPIVVGYHHFRNPPIFHKVFQFWFVVMERIHENATLEQFSATGATGDTTDTAQRVFFKATLYCDLRVITAAMLTRIRSVDYAEVFPHYWFGSGGCLAQNKWRKRCVSLGQILVKWYSIWFSLCIVSGRGMRTKFGYTFYLSHKS